MPFGIVARSNFYQAWDGLPRSEVTTKEILRVAVRAILNAIPVEPEINMRVIMRGLSPDTYKRSAANI